MYFAELNVPQNHVYLFKPQSEKMDVQTDYVEIVDKVEAAAPGMIYAFLSKTQNTAGCVATADQPDAMWNDIFKKYVDKYMRACSWVVQRPHVKYVTNELFQRAERIKRWTPRLVNKFHGMPEDRRRIAYFRSEEIVPEMDTVENRFVKFTMKAISERLNRFLEICRQHSNAVSSTFCEQLSIWHSRIDKMYRHPAFKGVGRFEGLKQESLALQRKQGYAQIYETWIILRHAISVSEKGLDVGYRPIWKLYELWCFIVILDMLRKRADLAEDKTKDPLKNLVRWDDLFSDPDADEDETATADDNSTNGSKVEYVFSDASKNREVRLIYQQTYTQSTSDEGATANLVEQIPDIVLKIIDKNTDDGGKALEYTYIFDAKYRVRSEGGKDCAKNETINDMHRYRDAILYRRGQSAGADKVKREAIGAYILYPGRPGQSKDYDRFIKEENIGAIALLPKRYKRDKYGNLEKDEHDKPVLDPNSQDGEKTLEDFINRILDKDKPVDYLGVSGGFPNVISTRGTSVMIGDASGAVLGHMAVAQSFTGKLTEWVRKTGYFPLPKNLCESPERINVLVIPATGNASLFKVKRLCTTSGAINKADVETQFNQGKTSLHFNGMYDPSGENQDYIGYRGNDTNGFFVWEVEEYKSKDSDAEQ